MKPLYIFVSLLFTASILYAFTRCNKAQPPQNNVLTVGIAAGYAPYISINERGAYEGFDIDVVNALAQQLNKELVLKDLGSMAPLMIALEQGSVDMIIWGLTITPARLDKLAMIHYQGESTTSNPLVFWQQAARKITSLDDMQGKVICIEPSSIQADIIAAYPNITTMATERIDDALLNIQYGKADAALLDPDIAKKFKAAYPDQIVIVDVPLPAQVQTQGMGIAIKKNNEAMIKLIHKAVDQLKADGTLSKLETQWNI